MSEKIENSTAHLLNSVRNHVAALADGGVIDPENVKWKVAKAEDRRAIVAARPDASNCELARELGCDEGTIRNDRKSENSEKTSENSETKRILETIDCGRFETIVIDPPWPMTKIAKIRFCQNFFLK